MTQMYSVAKSLIERLVSYDDKVRLAAEREARALIAAPPRSTLLEERNQLDQEWSALQDMKRSESVGWTKVPTSYLQALSDEWAACRQIGMARDGDDLGKKLMPVLDYLKPGSAGQVVLVREVVQDAVACILGNAESPDLVRNTLINLEAALGNVDTSKCKVDGGACGAGGYCSDCHWAEKNDSTLGGWPAYRDQESTKVMMENYGVTEEPNYWSNIITGVDLLVYVGKITYLQLLVHHGDTRAYTKRISDSAEFDISFMELRGLAKGLGDPYRQQAELFTYERLANMGWRRSLP